MAMNHDHRAGDIWTLPEGVFTFVQELAGRQLLLVPVIGEGTMVRHEDTLERQRSTGEATRRRPPRDKNGRIQQAAEHGDLPPNDGTDPKLDDKEKKARSRAFFVRKWDEAPCGTGKVALGRLIADHRKEARRLGYTWIPSVPTLVRAINERGEPGRRRVEYMQDGRGKTKRDHWGAVGGEVLHRGVLWFYSRRARTQKDAYAYLVRFVGKVRGWGERRGWTSWARVKLPCKEVVRLRIRKAETRETLTAKYNAIEGHRRMSGVTRGIRAEGLLDVVIFDGNVLDGWVVIDEDTGVPCMRPTITAGLDVKSRVVPGIAFTFGGETLDGIIECVTAVNMGKHALIDRYPHLRDAFEDLYGRIDTALVDNAWRQTGRSFQDCCADIGTNVEFVRVRNPEGKSPLERLWDTLNELLTHKLPGGIPCDPTTMRKLGFEPDKTKAITFAKLQELVYEALAVYHVRVHSGIGQPPLLAWKKGRAKKAREVIDDVNYLNKALGTVATATLTREGIRFRNQTFHDPETTTRLLEELSYTTPVRKRRKRPGSAKARVKIKYRECSVRQITVWNPRKQPKAGYDVLPNWNENFAEMPGLGFQEVALMKKFADAENAAFRTPEQQNLAHDRLRGLIESSAPAVAAEAARKRRELLRGKQPKAVGDAVLFLEGPASPGGLKTGDVVSEMAATSRADEGAAPKSPRRGGAAATAKGRRTRASNKARGADERGPAITQPSASAFRPTLLQVSDPAAFMAERAKRMARPGRSRG